MKETYPEGVIPSPHALGIYLRNYENLTGLEIEQECKRFYDRVSRGGKLQLGSGRYSSTLRGWLACADYNIEISSPSVS